MNTKTGRIELWFLVGLLGFVTEQSPLHADEQPSTTEKNASIVAQGISSNPGAVDVRTGTGELAQTVEKLLGLARDTGVYLGGVWVADANGLLSGGAEPGKWGFNSLLILGAGVDAEKLVGWKGGRFEVGEPLAEG